MDLNDIDPFEARLNFTSLLRKLNSSKTSIRKAASFIYNHPTLEDDIFSCILEQINEVSFYFIFFWLFLLLYTIIVYIFTLLKHTLHYIMYIYCVIVSTYSLYYILLIYY